MLNIGLTGGIGSGKTYVANLFATHGAALIDTDLLAHAITAPGGAAIEPIVTAFGPAFLTPEGAMDRTRMRQLVFNDAGAKARLEAITHPLIRQACDAEAMRVIEQGQAPYLVQVVPLLVESGTWKDRVDRVVVVDCPVAAQIARVMQRNNLSRQEVEAIVARQASREARLAVADHIIDNSTALEMLPPQVAALHSEFLSLSGSIRRGTRNL